MAASRSQHRYVVRTCLFTRRHDPDRFLHKLATVLIHKTYTKSKALPPSPYSESHPPRGSREQSILQPERPPPPPPCASRTSPSPSARPAPAPSAKSTPAPRSAPSSAAGTSRATPASVSTGSAASARPRGRTARGGPPRCGNSPSGGDSPLLSSSLVISVFIFYFPQGFLFTSKCVMTVFSDGIRREGMGVGGSGGIYTGFGTLPLASFCLV